ncbi:MAG TPA: hypothetical protein VLB09_02145 [Nitrospiria bacterium]|nr:hypothetical protein [Nitrospiria bacterium]
MKIQTVPLHSQEELEAYFLSSIETLPGEPRLLEKSLKTDFGPVALGADGEGRLCVLLTTLAQDDSALVRILAIEGWLKRNRQLIERTFEDKAVDFEKAFRLVLAAPGFSGEIEEAVRQIPTGVELVRYRAVSVNRQVGLFLDSLFQEKASGPSGENSPPASKMKPEKAPDVGLTDEENRFFSVGSPPV